MRLRIVFGGFLAVAAVSSAAILGEDLQTMLQGQVEEIKDPPAGIPGVEVEIFDAKGKSLKTALTDKTGLYTIHGLPRGASVSIQLRRNGYKANPTVLPPVLLAAEKNAAPKADMVKSQGDDTYYTGVARAVSRRLQTDPADGKALQKLLDSLGPTEKKLVNEHLRTYGISDAKLRKTQGEKPTLRDPKMTKDKVKTAAPPPQ